MCKILYLVNVRVGLAKLVKVGCFLIYIYVGECKWSI